MLRSFAVQSFAMTFLYKEVAAGDFNSIGIEMVLVLRNALM